MNMYEGRIHSMSSNWRFGRRWRPSRCFAAAQVWTYGSMRECIRSLHILEIAWHTCSRFILLYNFFCHVQVYQITALAMTFDCFCMIQAAYCCISRIALLRNAERGAMRVFQTHLRRRGVYLFSI